MEGLLAFARENGIWISFWISVACAGVAAGVLVYLGLRQWALGARRDRPISGCQCARCR